MHTVERDIQVCDEWSTYATDLSKVRRDVQRLAFYRERNSHRGLEGFPGLRKLNARQVNQSFLNTICKLDGLEYLHLEVVTADDLAPLARLRGLKTLKLEGVRRATEFGPVLSSPLLRRLFLSHVKHLTSLELLSDAHDLVSLGVEGSTWTSQRVESVAPLRSLRSLEALFMTSVTLVDKDLSPLAEPPRLRILECARFAPESRFRELRRLAPNLDCRWCDDYSVETG